MELDAARCPVLPGDHLQAIVSPEYVWRSAGGRVGVHLQLVQLLLLTDRGRYRASLFAGPAPDPEGRPEGRAEGRPERGGRRPPPSVPPPPPRKPPTPAAGSGSWVPSIMDLMRARKTLKRLAEP